MTIELHEKGWEVWQDLIGQRVHVEFEGKIKNKTAKLIDVFDSAMTIMLESPEPDDDPVIATFQIITNISLAE